MRTAPLDESEPRGFSGLAALAVSVDDLLTDIAGTRTEHTNEDVAHLFTGMRASERSVPPRRNRFALAATALVITVVVAGFFMWRLASNGQSAPPIAANKQADNTSLIKPALGRYQVLSRGEIRYCLAEEMRLQAARDLATTTAIDVAQLNQSVNDLNARCGSYQYQGGDLELARADVRLRAAEIKAAGRRAYLLPDAPVSETVPVLAAGTSASSDESAPVDAPMGDAVVTVDQAAAKPASAKSIRDLQWLLFKLGFYNGVMSGVDSENSQQARRAYLASRGHDPSSDVETTFALAQSELNAEQVASESEGGVDRATIEASTDDKQLAEAEPLKADAPDLSALADIDRLAIEQLCRALNSEAEYAPCLATQLVKLESAPRVSLEQLDERQRSLMLQSCGPLRTSRGPAAYYLCLSSESTAVRSANVARPTIGAALPANVVSAIESRCSAQATATAEYARCVSGQFSNLTAPMNAVFMNALTFSERESIEQVCTRDPGVGAIALFYSCVQAEVTQLQNIGPKPDMRVASFSHREEIESSCRLQRESRGPAKYYQCLQAELSARGY